jgi:hemoglobin/transferrin/lactoferrin receptor protein
MATTAPQPNDASQSKPPGESPSNDTPPLPRIFETITVTTTLNPVVVKETPGTVSVIDAETIQRRLIENVADLVKFEPGVYIDSNLTRGGLNGFNIRGIGGNRVMTQVDGVETSEQFDFGPFNVHQFALDMDTLESAEIVRSAGSSLYGSDALGGVVSFLTKNPADYLASRRFHFGAKTLFDGRSGDTTGNFVIAGGDRRVQSSLFLSYGNGRELGNKGEIRTPDANRTAPNPQDRKNIQALGKMTLQLSTANILRGTIEITDSRIETQSFTSRVPSVQSVQDVVAHDTMKRRRYSLDHTIDNRGGLKQWAWSVFLQNSDTAQIVNEVRSAGAGVTANRRGTLDYGQDTFGGTIQGKKLVTPGGSGLLLTFGGSYKYDRFDMLRDRLDLNAATGAVIPTTLILPTKYFPKSGVGEAGSYLQGVMKFGRVTLIPAVRYDRFSLDADAKDQVFLNSLSPAPADFSAGAISSKLGASVQVSEAVTLFGQYAGGFRAPPYSAVNSGFTNLLGGYTSIPNTKLRAETSNNFEAGVRSTFGRVSVGVTGFSNYFDDFIQQVARGVNPSTSLLEFQYQNVSKVEIRGLELQGEAPLTDTLRLRGSYAVIRGNDVSSSEKVPLNSIAPDQGIVGLQYSPRSNRWGTELTVRAVRKQSQGTAGTGMFAPSGYGVADVFGWVSLKHNVTLRAGVLNLTDKRYFEWPCVRGRSATDPTIDRYSNPGVSAMVSMSYGW